MDELGALITIFQAVINPSALIATVQYVAFVVEDELRNRLGL